MLSDEMQNIGSGRLTEGIEQDSSIRAVVDFVEINFAEFAVRMKGETTASEKALTDRLCKFLNRKAGGYPFFFHHENVENHATGNSPQTDIGTLSREERLEVGDRNYDEFDSFFSLEAKRLPTIGHHREREYVVGHTKPNGGIERFKKGIHGEKLKYAAIIGYIQQEDFDYWFLKVNEWINDLINSSDGFWLQNDKLNSLNLGSSTHLTSFESNCSRISKSKPCDPIKILHFWINLVPE